MTEVKKDKILELIKVHPQLSSKAIHDLVAGELAYASVKRILTQLIEENRVLAVGQGKARKYSISPYYELFYPIQLDLYFEQEIDERKIKSNFNPFLLTDLFQEVKLFSEEEMNRLSNLQQEYLAKVKELNAFEYAKELERLAIDLSWKSSQIEGNTYSLLETERLLRDKETAAGKTKDDAVMLLNHKDALDFIIENKNYVNPLTLARIEDIHSLLVKDLGIDRNIRKRRVGISGTNYTPLDNEHQIREALINLCALINKRENVFEKALLALLFLSYIQPFGDGNKRTARIVSNAILIANDYCPLSFRTVDSIEYKKAMLVFYEQNNLMPFKEIFIDQFDFAVKTYF